MATSGSIDLVATRDDIITEALEQLGVLAEGGTPTAAMLTSSARTLNYMIKAWQGEGLNLFALKRQYLFLKKNQREYTLNSSTSDHFTSSFIQTTLSAAQTSGNNTVSLSDGTGTTNSDNIGIETGSNVVEWFTISSGGGTGSITLSGNLAADAASGNVVYYYTSKANRPMNIMEAVTRDSGKNDTPLEVIERELYVDLSSKVSDGEVSQIYYDRNHITPTLYTWPETDDETEYVVFWVQRTLEDVDAATDDLDYPQEWYLALAFGLAMNLSGKYGTPKQIRDYVAQLALMYKEIAEGFDREGSIYFTPDSRMIQGPN